MGYDNDIEKNTVKKVENTKKGIYKTNSDEEEVEHEGSLRSSITTVSKLEDSATMQHKSTEDIPDGGYGWYILIAGFLVNFITLGDTNIWGVYSNAYATMDLNIKGSTTQLMTVGTLMALSCMGFAPICPFLFRFGYRFTLIVGNIFMVLGLILASFSTKIWHLYLTQGFLFGLGGAIEFMTIISVIPQWFSKRRGIAMGISSAGSGIGGLVLSPLANYLIHTYGIEWTYRIMALIAFCVNVIVVCLVRTRGDVEGKKKPTLKSSFNFRLLKDINFALWLFGSAVSLLGYLVPMYYIPKYCHSLGIDSSRSSVLVGVVSATNAIGRLSLGFLADYIGRLNTFIIGSALSSLFCLLIWPFSNDFGSILAFTILFGLTCGIYYVVAPPVTAQMVGPSNISSGLSLTLITSSILSVGPPASSKILEVGGYLGVQMFSGSVYLFSVIVCIFIKVRLTGSLFSNI